MLPPACVSSWPRVLARVELDTSSGAPSLPPLGRPCPGSLVGAAPQDWVVESRGGPVTRASAGSVRPWVGTRVPCPPGAVGRWPPSRPCFSHWLRPEIPGGQRGRLAMGVAGVAEQRL